MPRRKPKKINYMDMKIPLEEFRIPIAKKEQIKLIKRFETEFGDDYRLDPWIDPCLDIDRHTLKSVYVHDSIEEKIERIKRRNKAVAGFRKALEKGDMKLAKKYNSLRDGIGLHLPGGDNGFNMTPGNKKRLEDYEKRTGKKWYNE